MSWRNRIAASAFSLALAVPAFAGHGSDCARAISEATPADSIRGGIIVAEGIDLRIDTARGALRVARIVPGARAEVFGLHEGDVILAVNGIALGANGIPAIASTLLPASGPGRLTIEREGHTREIEAVPGELSERILDRYTRESTARMHDRLVMQQAARDLGRLSPVDGPTALARN